MSALQRDVTFLDLNKFGLDDGYSSSSTSDSEFSPSLSARNYRLNFLSQSAALESGDPEAELVSALASTFIASSSVNNQTNPATPASALSRPRTANTLESPSPLARRLVPIAQSPLLLTKAEAIRRVGERVVSQMSRDGEECAAQVIEPTELMPEEISVIGRKRLIVAHFDEKVIVGRCNVKATNLLGKGSFSEVFKAKIYTSEERGAFKVAREGVDSLGQPISNELVTESENLNDLDALGVGVQKPYYGLVRFTHEGKTRVGCFGPCIDGDLMDVYEDKPGMQFTFHQKIEMGRQLLKQLSNMIHAGWGHGDIKLENVFLYGNTARFGDWGPAFNPKRDINLSYVCVHTTNYMTLTDAGILRDLVAKYRDAVEKNHPAMILHYASKIQKHYSARDIFAAGLTIFTNLSGYFAVEFNDGEYIQDEAKIYINMLVKAIKENAPELLSDDSACEFFGLIKKMSNPNRNLRATLDDIDEYLERNPVELPE